MRSKTVEKNEKRQKRRSIDQSAESVSKKKDKSEKAKVELRHTIGLRRLLFGHTLSSRVPIERAHRLRI